jgi:Phage integrase family
MHRDMPVVFFAALPERWRLFFILLAHSGMRVGEALGLTWRNVHRGDDPYLAIREQIYNGERKGLKSSHSDRRIPLSPKLARELQRWYEASEFTAPGDPVFPNSEGGPLNYHNLYNRVFKPAKQACGFEWPKGIAFHEFRRTAASLLHHHGKSGRQVCDWLGHHDPRSQDSERTSSPGPSSRGCGVRDRSSLCRDRPPVRAIGLEDVAVAAGDLDERPSASLNEIVARPTTMPVPGPMRRITVSSGKVSIPWKVPRR